MNKKNQTRKQYQTTTRDTMGRKATKTTSTMAATHKREPSACAIYIGTITEMTIRNNLKEGESSLIVPLGCLLSDKRNMKVSFAVVRYTLKDGKHYYCPALQGAHKLDQGEIDELIEQLEAVCAPVIDKLRGEC